MMELKTISRDAIPRALAKAERYRLLNEPRDAESICRDVLRTDPEHQEALVVMLLSLTDQFNRDFNVAVNHAEEVLPRLRDDFQRAYYAGVICERWAKALLSHGTPGYVAYEWFLRAMRRYEQAQSLASAGNEDANLRWNACVRVIKRNNSSVRPKPQDQSIEAGYEDEVPHR